MAGSADRRGVCVVLAAPSGAGKSTILRMLLDSEPGIVASVSVTTRRPRAGEREGVHYHFRSEAEFGELVSDGAMLEHATVFGRGYGTLRGPMLALLEAGRDVVTDIDWQGWRQLRTALPLDSVGVFLLPPSLADLERRLRDRGSDDPGEVGRRMAAAQAEILHWSEFDHVLVNDDLGACLAGVKAVLQAARATPRRNLAAARLAGAMGGVPAVS